MAISAKTEYACLATLQLAAHYESGEPVRVREIAEAHGIPPSFLVQILLQLKGAGLVTSTRGAGGGYKLTRPPEEISLGEVMAVIDGADQDTEPSASSDTAGVRVLHAAWREAAELQRDVLDGATFDVLLERAQSNKMNMYYI